MKKPIIFSVLAAIALLALAGPGAAPLMAQAAQEPKPFGLPFAEPPGPTTWLLGQVYGNTTGAYSNRRAFYSAGQGLHFGIDLSAPCKTPIVAIGDGVVVGADGPWGSAPHNLLINHENGWMSMYGHLYEKPALKAGQRVKKGEVVALSGDPDVTCYSRPHLHLEIRDVKNTHFANPMELIEADWNSLALAGGSARFERDLDDPRKWQSMFDQPDAYRGRPFLNEFAKPWPPSFR